MVLVDFCSISGCLTGPRPGPSTELSTGLLRCCCDGSGVPLLAGALLGWAKVIGAPVEPVAGVGESGAVVGMAGGTPQQPEPVPTDTVGLYDEIPYPTPHAVPQGE